MHTDADRQETRGHLKAAVAARQATDVVRYARELLRSNKAADTMFCASAFKSIAGELVDQGYRRLNTYIVRSVTVEPVLPFLTVEAVLSGYVLDLTLGGYGSYIDEMLNRESELSRAKADLVFVLLELEDIAGRLPDLCADGRGVGVEAELEVAVARVGQMLRSYRSGNAGRLVMQGVVVPGNSSLGLVGDANLKWSLANTVKELNRRLAETCSAVSECVFFDVDYVAAQYGRAQWADPRMLLASRLPLSPGAFKMFAQGLVRTASVLFRAPRKVLCTDLDNTLWGGILGEDGPQGIVTGSAFPGNCFLEYQRYLKQLAARGILLAVTSKNNEADVEEAFQLRSADLGIHLNDFVVRKIGWADKTQALRELAQELNLGLDSFVFVDDNPIECEAIRQQLPEVAVLVAPTEEPWKLKDMLAEQSFFDIMTVTTDDLNRSQEYKSQAQRDALSMHTATRDEFLHSLEIVCTFVSALNAPLSRSVQLLAKTNQFNLTTRRHSSVEVEQFATLPGGLAVAVRVRDRFGDAGVVGLALATQEGDQCLIDSLLLSCRVIGRGIETALLAHVAEWAARMGSKWIVGEYIETKKNSPCASFYTEHGFERDAVSAGGKSIFYRLDLTEQMPSTPSWLTLEGNETHEFATNTLFTS
jgi:FkbH-like protein